MTEKVKKKNVQKSSRKVQSSNTRNRKSVKRPSSNNTKASASSVVAKEKDLKKATKKIEAAGKSEETKKQIVASEPENIEANESKAEQDEVKSDIVDIEPGDFVSEEKKEDLKVVFINDDVEKRPLGKTENLDAEIDKVKQIQHFAKEESVVLSDIVERIIEEKAPVNEVARVRHEGARNIDGIMSRPRPIREQTSSLSNEEIELDKKPEAKKLLRNSSKNKKRQTYRVNFGLKRILLALACASAAVFAIVYFVNLNAPNISLKVAAMQSGINASYPNYIPRNYYLSDITSESGKVSMNFKNPTTDESYSITEEASSWDSTALLNNFVKSEYGNDYTVLKEQGLTIYMTNRAACWTNGGVVFKLKVTSGSLTKKQIMTIAASL